MKRLFLLDAYALIYRAYYALIRSPRFTAKGFNTSAIFGFDNTLDDLLRKENPTHIAVCFDPSGPTFRHEMYEPYKAQRDKQPEDITLALPYIKRILAAYRIPAVEVAGYEADDVIGTLSRMAERQGFETFMMTPDKDYGQLVTDKVLMYRPALRGEGFEIRGPRQICERYGIDKPAQVIDLLALEGDASDNIPGCPGVGEKTAQKLIKEYGSIENLLDHVAEIKGALGRKLADNADQIRLCRTLVTIATDAPLPEDVTPDAFQRKPEDVDALIEIYRELEFKTKIERLNKRQTTGTQMSLFDATPASAPVSTLACPEGSYTMASSPAEVARAIETASSRPLVGLAVYSIGESAMTARFKGLALACDPCDAIFIPLPDDKNQRDEITQLIAPLFSQKVTCISCYEAKRAMLLLRREGITWEAPLFDPAIAHYLLDPEARHGLPVITERFLGLHTPLFPDQKQWFAEASISADDLYSRFGQEADISLRLVKPLRHAIDEQNMTSLLENVELPMARVLADMEWEGVRVNPEELVALQRLYSQRLDNMEHEAYEMAGHPFNIASPAQVGEILFGQLLLDPKAKKTATGAYSTTEKVLEKHRADHPLVDLILNIRKLRKLVATYLDPLPTLINPVDNKIHTTFNQTVTATGRISSANPNLQNIPVRSDDGREIRRAFIADPGCLFMSADYSQIELRLIAELSADPAMVDTFSHGGDIHRATAAKIYHLSPEEVTENQRRNAKTANFGTVYGISAFGLSERLNIPRAEAKMLIDGYFRTYPKVKEYIEQAILKAREKGYVETLLGRRRILPDIKSRNAVVRGYAERNAVNAPLQGTAADIIKVAMIAIHREINARGMRSRMIMQVHDELIFNVHPDELDELRSLVVDKMMSAHNGMVPLEVSVGVGQNWLEAH